ncbi:hypothetical protein WCQ02_38785, partial [Paraburkholderia tropica]|uniref:hypothetical protein n=1 Tax=Paraburkholderia tropica TaxID=92647 RepID=UPI0030165681
SENEDHHASKAGRPTCEQTLTADTPNVKKDHRSERVLCRPSLELARGCSRRKPQPGLPH